MPWELKYGADASLRLHLSQTEVVANCSQPRAEPLDDPAAAVSVALGEPLDFPPLQRAIVPGDCIAIALEQSVPRSAEVVAGALQYLLTSGHDLGQIAVVAAEPGDPAVRQQLTALPQQIQADVEVVFHDAADKNRLAYLAASSEGKPIYINRTLCDADFVLPVSTARVRLGFAYLGVHASFLPSFSDESTQQRFWAPLTHEWETQQRRRREEVEEAAWLLGIQCSLQLAPGAGNSVVQVMAGAPAAVAEASEACTEAAWRFVTERPAPLVIAAIEGGAQHQTWENLARAIHAASRAVTDGGALIICCGLSGAPGPALQRLMADGDDERVQRDLRRDRTPDAIAASLLASLKQRVRVYLLSDLAPDFVEDIGVGLVQDASEIERLSREFPTAILIGNAQHAVVEFEHETETAEQAS